MNFFHIIWDWNGTLLDDLAASIAAINHILVSRGLSPVTREHYLAHFGFPVRDYYNLVGLPKDISPREWQDIAEKFHRHLLAEPSQLFPDVRATLEHCARADIPQSVLSALHQPLLDKLLRQHNIAHFFQHIRGVDDLHGSSKLKAGRALLQQIALPPEKILLVGDTLHDAEVARELGVRCVLVTRGHQHPSRLATAGVPLFPSLKAALFND